MQSMADYNLLDVSEMGISDYLRNTRMMAPRWMNENELKAYKIGFNRARELCKSENTQKRK